MKSEHPGKSSLIKVYKITFQSLKNNPALFIPFIIFASLDFLALIFIYFAPRMPLRLVFGPIIKTFWGERFLHYPANFLLLPQLNSNIRMAISILFGSLLTGAAVAMIFGIYNKKQLKLKTAFKSALKNYISLACIVLIFSLLYYALAKIVTIVLVKYFISGHTRLLFLGARAWLGPVLFLINFILVVLIQSAFIYAIPILLIENKKLLKSITGSFALFKKLFLPTLILTALPILFYLPIVILQGNAGILINKFFPEIILLVSILGIIVNALIDLVITASCTVLYLSNRDGGDRAPSESVPNTRGESH